MLSAAKREGRAVGQGVVGIFRNSEKNKGTIVEVRCETDFVAKNELFLEFVQKLMSGQGGSEEERKFLISKVQENVKVERLEHMEVAEGTKAPSIAIDFFGCSQG